MGELPTKTIDYILANGVLGVTTVLFMYISFFIYKARDRDREQHTIDIEEIYKAHQVEIISYMKRLDELQEKRLEELRANLDVVSKFNASSLAVLARAGGQHV